MFVLYIIVRQKINFYIFVGDGLTKCVGTDQKFIHFSFRHKQLERTPQVCAVSYCLAQSLQLNCTENAAYVAAEEAGKSIPTLRWGRRRSIPNLGFCVHAQKLAATGSIP